jgi:hypothetical protein
VFPQPRLLNREPVVAIGIPPAFHLSTIPISSPSSSFR